tara:strand:- start:988 stop:1185 length:198 start_codon:yes stop_codon:yes gene_type:complete
MDNIEPIRPDENKLITKLNFSVREAVNKVLEAHEDQVTYVEVVGALEIIKQDFVLESMAISDNIE